MQTAVRAALFLFSLAGVAGCGVARDGHAALCRDVEDTGLRGAPMVERVVLVTLDGVRARELFSGVDPVLGAALPPSLPRDAAGLTPHLHALMARGLGLGVPGQGAPLRASGPAYVSLPGYRELLTGRRAGDCRDNGCGRLEEPTLLDQWRAAAHLQATEVAAIASWESLVNAVAAAPEAIAVSAGRHGGPSRERLRVDGRTAALLDAGAAAGAWPGRWDYRPDAHTASLALAYLEARRPRLLYVGLGDADEAAHRGDYRGYLEAVRRSDDFLGALVERLDAIDGEREGGGARTLIVVTADHGRAASFRGHGREPESALVWLVAAGGPVAARGVVPAAAAHRLADIAPTLRVWLGLDADRSPRAGVPIPELLAQAPAGLAVAASQ